MVICFPIQRLPRSRGSKRTSMYPRFGYAHHRIYSGVHFLRRALRVFCIYRIQVEFGFSCVFGVAVRHTITTNAGQPTTSLFSDTPLYEFGNQSNAFAPVNCQFIYSVCHTCPVITDGMFIFVVVIWYQTAFCVPNALQF